MNTIDAMKQALSVLNSCHGTFEATAYRDLSEAISREEAQTVIDKFVSSQESAGLTSDQIDELVFGEAQTVEPFAWVTQCKASGLIEQADPGEKATNPTHWTDAFPLFTHPAPPPSGEREALIARLRNTRNWQRESFGSWKNGTLYYDRAPFEAADMLAADARAHPESSIHAGYSSIDSASVPTNPAQQVAVPQGFGRIHVTEAMHREAVKVLHRASGLDGLPQRMMDAMLAAATEPPQAERVQMTKPEIHNMYSNLPTSNDVVVNLVAAVEAHHHIGVTP